MNNFKFTRFVLILIALQIIACSKKKQQEQQQTSPIITQQETQASAVVSDTLPQQEIPSRLPEAPLIQKIDLSAIEAKISPPVQIKPIRWDDSWTPKREELPGAIYWSFFDSSKVTFFTPAQKDALAHQGFFVEPAPPPQWLVVDDMIDLYRELPDRAYEKYHTVPAFVSTDLLLHVSHLLFDRSLQEMERTKFRPLLAVLTSRLYERSKEDYAAATDDWLKTAALRNQAYFAVAGALLAQKVYVVKELYAKSLGFDAGEVLNDAQVAELKQKWSGQSWGSDFDSHFDIQEENPLAGEALLAEVKSFVEAEIALIDGAKAITKSPLLEAEEDYSQFRPRGHYTRSEDLSSYFRAMMWYGRMPFSVENERATLQAILITRALQDGELGDYWAALMNPIDFLIGEQEDLGVGHYRQLLREVYGESPALEDFANREKLTQFRDQTRHVSPRRVAQAELAAKMPKQAFRFMGQRFVPDAEIFSKLTTTRVGTPERPRLMPKAADVMAILGSAFAETLLEKDKAAVPGYADSLQALKASYQKIATSQWQRNTYWCWLNALRSLLQEKDQRFPFFMRGLSWRKKSLLTSLSSWAELKHDTIFRPQHGFLNSQLRIPVERRFYVDSHPVRRAL